ncbi:MAG: alpha-ketoglutarate-dependent dioxygenase AlkB [Acidimicrobiia bacterium]
MHPAAPAAPATLDDCWPSSWQGSLFGLDEPAADPAFRGAERLELDESSWLEHCPNWLGGSDLVFAELVARLPWRQREVVMYDRLLPEPRLTCWWSSDDGRSEPLPVLADMRAQLTERYDRAFDSIGCNFYRDGHDSVAWHGDRVRHLADPVVAIVSVGAPRAFLLRPRGGGSSRGFMLGQGDLLVMGGDCQIAWEHAVPKVAAAGPRISVTFRHGGPAPYLAPDAHRRRRGVIERVGR